MHEESTGGTVPTGPGSASSRDEPGSPPTPWRDRLSLGLALLAILLRIPDLRWGLPEVLEEATPVRKAFEMWGWDYGRLDLDPHTAGWPSLAFYLHLALQHAQFLVGRLTGQYQGRLDFFVDHLDPSTLMVPARLVSVVASAALVWVGARLARRLTGRVGAVITGSILLTSPLLMKFSLQASPDMLLTLFSALALSRILDTYEKGRVRDYLGAAVWIALGSATKYTPILLVPCLASAHLARTWRSRRWGALVDRRLLLALGVGLATFVATSPFTVLDLPVARRDIASQFVHVTKGHFGHELRGNGYIYYLVKAMPAALGWAGFILGLAGLTLATWRRRSPWFLVLLSFACYYVGLGALRSVYDHYILPALLPLALGVGGLAGEIRPSPGTSRRRLRFVAACGLLAVVLIPPGVRSVRRHVQFHRPGTIQLAKQFIMEELNRPDAWFACELGGPELPRDPAMGIAKRPVFRRLDATNRRRVLDRPFANVFVIPLYMVDAHGADLYYDLRHYLAYDYVVVSQDAQGRYTGLADDYPRQITFYDDLERYCRLVRDFPSSPDRLGPEIRIYAVNAEAKRILDDRRDLAPGFQVGYLPGIHPDHLYTFLANTGLAAKTHGNWRAADLYLSTLLAVTPPHQRLAQLMAVAEAKYRSGNVDGAERLCRELLRQRPEHREAQALLAAIRARTADPPDRGPAAEPR